MPNVVKYNTSTESLSLKKNNFYIGTGDVGKGPTSSTGFYNGISPPSGGYTIYLNKASGGPSIYTASNDAALISITNQIAGTSYTSATQCLVYYYTQTDKMVVNNEYNGLITDGLVIHVDAGFTPSYPRSGVTMDNLTYTATTAGLYNGIGWGDYGVGGAFLFDGIDDAITVNYSYTDFSYVGQPFSLCAWANKTQTNPQTRVVQRGLSGGGGYWGFGFTNGTQLSFFTGSNSTGATQFSTNNIISNNTWYYIVSTFDNNSNAKLYLNGNDVTGTPVSLPSPPVPSYPVCYNLGLYNCLSGGYKEYFKGYIAQHSGYNKVLTADEVLQNFNATKSRFGY